MTRVNVLVLRAAGTNCDAEAVHAFARASANVERVHVNRLVEGRVSLDRFHVLVIPGGFTYGDDLGAGTVLANRLRVTLHAELTRFVDAGRLVLGICNGFQALVKAGFLPGPEFTGKVTLTANESTRFEDRWIHLQAVSGLSPFVAEGTRMYVPVAHGEGRFVAQDAEALRALEASGQVVLRYVSNAGGEAAYPDNPNGSQRGIAGVCDPTGRVLGLMPHPERHVSRLQHPHWTRIGDPNADGDGLVVFRNAVEYARKHLI
ncbi:MAG: phosphoribosylformylglycinamidine synthase I [Planctomycetes bacterium]|nr:phosphoribosylformylglycinamidine synthase I [Planctomycetota bacterium]